MFTGAGREVAWGLLGGTVLDFVIPDPRTGHPVAAFGRAAGLVEKRTWADSRARGAAFTAVCAGMPVAMGTFVDRAFTGRPARVLVIAAATWAVLGSRSLRAEASALEALLTDADLPAARLRLRNLVGRDPAGLDETEIARAAAESVAENTCDAVVAPLLWGAVAGLPGLLGYRAVNTLDAMVGHHSPRYERFGWASARLDDIANSMPARVTALLVAVAAPTVGGRPLEVLRIVRRDGRRHPSPNSGLSESAFAGALGRRLGGRNVYGGRVEDRPVLGDGPPIDVPDLSRAQRLCATVTVGAAVAAFGLALRGRR